MASSSSSSSGVSSSAGPAGSAKFTPPYVALVTGANRGLGLEFVRQLLQTDSEASSFVPKDALIIATARHPEAAKDLLALQQEHGEKRLVLLPLVATDSKDIAHVADTIASRYGRLDFLLNNAGVCESDPESAPATIDRAIAENILLTNALAPTLLTQALLPTLRATTAKRQTEGAADPFARVVFISSSMGSIGVLANGNSPSYRASKAALNMYIRCFAMEEKDIAFMALHPGWVQTEMGMRGNRMPPLTPHQSIAGCLKTIGGLTLAKSGTALEAFDQTTWPW